MPRVKTTNGYTTLWLSARDTYEWANRPGARWPGSVLAGRRMRAVFEPSGDLVDVTVDGRYGVDVPGDEFDAITTDHLPDGHPARRP